MSIRLFDIESYLQKKGIHYDPEGKNVSSGWIGINCFWCDDPSNHLGINLENKKISCYKCKTSGTVYKIIMRLERCDFDTAKSIVESNQQGFALTDSKDPEIEQIRPLEIDFSNLHAVDYLMTEHRDYLNSRELNAEEIFKKYRLMCCHQFGPYAWRLIIPFWQHDRMLTFTARDITGQAKIPYLHLPKDKGLSHPKETLYNLSNNRDVGVVVEGPVDVWNIGSEAVATCGTQYTSEQFNLLKTFKRLFILYDAGDLEEKISHQLACDLSTFVPDVVNIRLSEGDPGNLPSEDVKRLRRELFGKVY